ncbi:MAG: RHS repeat-associated core domain-containing protein [Terrimicrobiaceae bacterium]|jgi:RHS repeat-associated protein
MKKQKISAEKCACRKRNRLAALVAGILATAMLPLAAHAEQKSLPGMGVQPAEYFYTGKPYDSDTVSYTFKYRNYDPELNRWTTMDPSGFPDGANNQFYAPIPTAGCDPFGLYSEQDAVNDFATVGLAKDLFSLAGFGMSLRRANHSLSYGDNETAPSGEINALKSASAFTSIFNKAYFTGLVGGVGQSSPYDNTSLVTYGGISDLHFSYGQLSFNVTGEFTWDQNNKWSTVASFTFEDLYNFDINSPIEAVAAFARLQENNYAGMYNTTGTFNITFNE